MWTHVSRMDRIVIIFWISLLRRVRIGPLFWKIITKCKHPPGWWQVRSWTVWSAWTPGLPCCWSSWSPRCPNTSCRRSTRPFQIYFLNQYHSFQNYYLAIDALLNAITLTWNNIFHICLGICDLFSRNLETFTSARPVSSKNYSIYFDNIF